MEGEEKPASILGDSGVAEKVSISLCGDVKQPSEAQQVSHKYGAAHIPKANTNSSNKVKAAYAHRAATIAQKSAKRKRKHNQRALNKRKKQNDNMYNVLPHGQLPATSSTLANSIVFVNGDNEGTPINPDFENSTNMSIAILSVATGDLHAPRDHLLDPSKGLVCRPSTNVNDAFSFMLVPRERALRTTGCYERGSQNKAICEALDALESASRNTEARGKLKVVVREEDHDKYICTGTWVRRAGKGVQSTHYILQRVDSKHAKQILNLIKRIESLFEEWCDTKQIGLVSAAMHLVDPETFTIPGQEASAKIYSGIAHGRNVYLNSHTDQDFTFSAITIHLKNCEYNLSNRVVAYFCFRRLGIAVPLRPGDVLFFNPQEEHCVSSRCHSEDEIYCVSLYLKSANLGLHDNDIKLMPREKKSLSFFNANLKK